MTARSRFAAAAALLLLTGAVRAETPDYVGSQACAGCHADAAAAWAASHHTWAWNEPDRTTVLGDFDDAIFEYKGETTRFSTRDGRFLVETDGPDGTRTGFEVAYTAGVEPLQQYLVETEPGRLQALDVAWDTEAGRWYHLYPDQDLRPGDGLHWTGPYKNWNGRCAQCHATGYEKAYDPRTRRFSSRQSEIGVGCEACHGPGEAHVAWAAAPGSDASGPGLTGQGFTIDFAAGSAETEIQLCAGCHARRETLSDASPLPGTTFDDAYRLALLREGLYHADGQILDEVYVYGSFLQSRMYAAGVRCSDCHEPHGAGLRTEGNALCTACHNPGGNPRFPSLKAADYDAPSHHFHPDGGPGGRCVDCHMPERTYMVVDPRRDHGFRVPRPDLSVTHGTPNACSGCHVARDDAWAADQVTQRYPVGRAGSRSFAGIIAAGRAARAGANLWLDRLAEDTRRPPIVRATALDLLRRYGPGEVKISLLSDPSPLVRRSAVRLFEASQPQARAASLPPLLTDPRRTVRIEAARLLLDVPPQLLSSEHLPALGTALQDYRQTLLATVDFPETQMNLAQVAYRTGNLRAAERALSTALELDPGMGQAWISLGELQHLTGRSQAARSTFRAGLEKLPKYAPLHRALGLLEAESGDLPRAAESLDRAAALAPQDSRVRYNLGLVLGRLGKVEVAEAALREAAALAPTDPEVRHALGLHLFQSGRPAAAREVLQRLLSIHPDYAPAVALLQMIETNR